MRPASGIARLDVHERLFPTATFQQLLHGKETGTTGADDDFAVPGQAPNTLASRHAWRIMCRGSTRSRSLDSNVRPLVDVN